MSRRWRIGQEFILRHGGMPFDWLEELGAPGSLLELADRVIAHEKVVLGLVDARSAGQRAAAVRADIRRGHTPQLPKSAGSIWAKAIRAWANARQAYALAYRDADEQVGKRLRELLARPEFSEAVFLCNPDAYRNMLLPFVAQDGPLISRRRRVRRQMYTYVQRFYAHNGTVSFFGPMAYGCVREGDRTELRRVLPRIRKAFLSHWAARALRHAIARDPGFLPHLAFHTTGRGNSTKEPLLALIAPRGSIVRDLAQAARQPAGQVVRTLLRLAAAEAVTVRLGGGEYNLAPLTTLREQLTALPDSPARRWWLSQLGELARLLAGLTGQSLKRKVATVTALERCSTELTGKPARRRAGAPYADRAVFFEECASTFSLTIGADLIRRGEELLSPVMEWCVTHGHAAHAIGPEGPAMELSLLDYANRAANERSEATSRFQGMHAPRWPGTAWRREIERLAAEATALEGDRYAVVDLSLSASDVTDFDDAAMVLSRAHSHLLVHSWLGTMHPDPARLGADAAAWVAQQEGRVVGLDFGRHDKDYYRFPGREVAMRPLTWTDQGDSDLLRPEELQVSIRPETITLRGPDIRPVTAYVPVSDFVEHAPLAALSHPQLLHPTSTIDGEQPEVRLGAVVLQPPRWQVLSQGLVDPEPSARFLKLRGLARRTSSRFVYCRSAREREPYLVDLASLLAADLIGHVARGHGELVVERMAPGPESLWLRDAKGRRYTSELRMQIIGRSERA
ncbi:lantibiotic dehydratase [Streptomyces sp. NBC_01619]|uniref:lantibiotic dehydratase n=1 Tax=Streptomyces sp. NBC_01619 TaxID=2975901 RepID=UPI00225680EC|nr:lantibiotic dehydratase [Streptomyces sp. NBC_01619]MCX4515756.1 lantibiotic dehydratase [Streptomyces sp. NBC_01619]